MAYIEYRTGDFIRFKDDHKKIYSVTKYDSGDGTVRAISAVHGELDWTRNSLIERVPSNTKLISIQRGATGKPEKPEQGAAKLRKAMEAVEKLKKYEKFL